MTKKSDTVHGNRIQKFNSEVKNPNWIAYICHLKGILQNTFTDGGAMFNTQHLVPPSFRTGSNKRISFKILLGFPICSSFDI